MIRASVVLPTFNRLSRLKRVLAGLEEQTYPLADFEVVVVSDGSQDGTNEFLQSLKTPLNLKLVLQPNQGVAVARNSGVAAATGEMIVFVDDDVVPDVHLITEHLHTHAVEGDHVVVIGPMLTPAGFSLAPWVRWGQERLVEQYRAMSHQEWQPTARQFYTGNASLARRHFLEYGGFDPTFRRAEDVELAYRLEKCGFRFIFNSQAVGYHYEERSFASWLAIPYAYGRNDVIFTRQKGQNWLLPTIFQEYHTRHPFVRSLTWLCLDRPRLKRVITAVFQQIAQTGDRYKVDALLRLACSSLFNLYHYQGVSDELGGRKQFFTEVAQG